MYREPAPRDASKAPPAELVFEPRVRGGRGVSGLAVLQVFALPGVVAVALSTAIGPTAGLAGLLGTAAIGVFLWRRKPRGGYLLRVEDGALSILRRPSRKVERRVELADLADVLLDTKTIAPVMEGTSAIPAMRLLDTRVGPEVDTARIALIDAEGTTFYLGKEDLAHMDATEWFARLRTFLRKHGWVPLEERGSADVEG